MRAGIDCPRHGTFHSGYPAFRQGLALLALVLFAGCGAAESVTAVSGVTSGFGASQVDAAADPAATGQHGDPVGSSPASTTTDSIQTCPDALEAIVAQCAEASRQIVAGCVEKIAALIAEGRLEEALAAARACIEELSALNSDCLARIREQCQACLFEPDDRLDGNATDLHARPCRTATEQVLNILRRSIHVINEALDQGIARRCIDEVGHISYECAMGHQQLAETCIQQIQDLCGQGQEEAAAKAAQMCIGVIRGSAGKCARVILEKCHRCLQRLTRECGNGELVQMVQEACELAIQRVVDSARQAAQAVQDALPCSDLNQG